MVTIYKLSLPYTSLKCLALPTQETLTEKEKSLCILINNINSLWETLDSSCLRFLSRFPVNAIYNCQGEQQNFFKGGGVRFGETELDFLRKCT